MTDTLMTSLDNSSEMSTERVRFNSDEIFVKITIICRMKVTNVLFDYTSYFEKNLFRDKVWLI